MEEFQSQVLKTILTDKDFVPLYYDVLRPEYFENAVHRMIVEEVIGFFDKYKKTPTIIELVSLFKKETKETVINAIDEVSEIEDASTEYIANNLQDFALMQAVKLAYVQNGDLIQDGNLLSIRNLWDQALVSHINRQQLGIGLFSDEGFDKRINYRENTSVVPTPWPTINDILDGGAWAGELYLISTLPNAGKSTLLMNVGIGGLLAGKFVVHISTEMSDIKTGLRYDSRITGIPRRKLVNDPDRYKDRVLEHRAFFKGQVHIKSYPPETLTIDELYGYLATIQRIYNKKIDMLIVDYPDEMRPTTIRKERLDREAGEIFSGLRKMAGEFNMPVWAATQVKRSVSSKEKGQAKTWKDLTLGDLSESWDKAKKPDFIVAFYQTPDEYAQNIGNFIILKNRDNERPPFPIRVMVSFSTHKVVEVRIGKR